MARPSGRFIVQAGEIYRARAPRGHRYVRVLRVRRSASQPYAEVRECSAGGNRLRGRDRDGLDRTLPFDVRLSRDGAAWAMPSGYERHQHGAPALSRVAR